MQETVSTEAHAWMLVGVGKPLEPREIVLVPGPDDVVIKVAGCGVCHTDVSFAVDGVPTRRALPLILGHEIVGQVVATGRNATPWKGERVLVPAVIPCDTCAACRAGRPTICRNQFMPGNDGDGGFASHVVVPARHLCPVPRRLPEGLGLADLAVVADAVTTPYEALARADVGPEDVVVFVGAGGVGGFGVQIAAARGAAVVAIDVDPTRLELARQHGAALALQSTDVRQLKSAVRAFQKESGRRAIGLKVFETSGTPAGQETAFALLDHGAYLGVVGYTAEKAAIRLSNLMALDATARGNWGCAPSRYPEALQLVLDGKVVLDPFIERHPLHEARDVLAAVAAHAIRKRPVLVPPA
jgi:6-hydroxycyclohex-1-ene-1-carbonyl-CoA dehydrogenase